MLHYIIVEDDKIVGKIRMFSPGMSKSAPCVIVICADLVDAEEKGGAIIKDSVPLDAAFASQNILLKAHEIGLGTCVVKSYNESSVGTILKLPSYITPLLIITVGYYEELPKPPSRKDVSQVIHFNDWEGR